MGQTGSTQPSRLSSSWWYHYRLLAICDLERHPVSSHSLPPHEPPSQAGRPCRVLYRRVEISVRAHRERQLPSGCLLQLAICCHVPCCFPAISTYTDRGHHIRHPAFEQEGSESYLPCSHLDEEGAFRFLKSVMQLQPFFCRRFVCRFLSTASMPGP